MTPIIKTMYSGPTDTGQTTISKLCVALYAFTVAPLSCKHLQIGGKNVEVDNEDERKVKEFGRVLV
jgi:hypothetical protein